MGRKFPHSTFYFIVGIIALSCQQRTQMKVAIQPLGTMEQRLIDTVSSILAKEYGMTVEVLKMRPLPKEAFVNIKSPRYRADVILKILRKEKPKSCDFILALTEKDISTSKRNMFGRILEPKSKNEDWGIFGLGYQPGDVSVVSTFRLGGTNQKVFIGRLKKIVIHEIGHNLGLEHCGAVSCVMRDAEGKLATVDKAASALCSECPKKIGSSW